jgi:hypothetical protein
LEKPFGRFVLVGEGTRELTGPGLSGKMVRILLATAPGFLAGGAAVEFLVRAVTIYAWYVAVVALGVAVIIGVLCLAPYVRKWRKR